MAKRRSLAAAAIILAALPSVAAAQHIPELDATYVPATRMLTLRWAAPAPNRAMRYEIRVRADQAFDTDGTDFNDSQSSIVPTATPITPAPAGDPEELVTEIALEAERSWYFGIRSWDFEDKESGVVSSNEILYDDQEIPAPAAITTLAILPGAVISTGITITWGSTPPGARDFQVRISGGPEGEVTQPWEPAYTTWHPVTNLRPATTYTFHVRMRSGSGPEQVSGDSNAVTATTLAAEAPDGESSSGCSTGAEAGAAMLLGIAGIAAARRI